MAFRRDDAGTDRGAVRCSSGGCFRVQAQADAADIAVAGKGWVVVAAEPELLGPAAVARERQVLVLLVVVTRLPAAFAERRF